LWQRIVDSAIFVGLKFLSVEAFFIKEYANQQLLVNMKEWSHNHPTLLSLEEDNTDLLVDGGGAGEDGHLLEALTRGHPHPQQVRPNLTTTNIKTSVVDLDL
jgi:hypothetical protein